MKLRSADTTFRLSAEEIKDVVRSRAHCLRAGFSANDSMIRTFNDIRSYYILKVGLPTYLAHMLGDLGKVPIQYCTLYTEDGQPIEIPRLANPYQTVQRFISRQFQHNTLPFKVEIRSRSNYDRVVVCYL